ncbi:MAG: NAD-dependent epimerase/dehydratase family protein [Chloroflexota bacterium]
MEREPLNRQEPDGPRGDAVFLTGASGFVGGHVLRALLDAGYRVHALVRPGNRLRLEPGVTPVTGDLTATGILVRHLDACRYLVHVAARYTFAPAQREAIHKINVQGTRGLLEAARIAGIEKAVVTSSSATVGPARNGRPATEEHWALDHDSAGYHRSKILQERVALAAQLPVVLVLPTMPIGARDWKPTPTGKLIVDFMRGRIFAFLDGGMNVVPVEDAAQAHVLALQHGEPGERYLAGGENLTMADLWERLATICNRKAPTRRIPYSVALGLGWADELRCRSLSGDPLVPLEGVRMARDTMWASSLKAEKELGYRSTPVDAALGRAVNWYRLHGYAN